MKYLLPLACGLLLCSACTHTSDGTEETTASSPALKELLVGNWESVSLRVDIPSANQSEADEQLLVPAGAWPEKVGMLPIRLEYLPNNTYRVEFRSLEDSVIRLDRGVWNIFGDTLMLIEADASYQYRIRIKNNHLEKKATLDWDGDGQEDDLYECIYKKVEKKSE